jgi:hypothetical protein
MKMPLSKEAVRCWMKHVRWQKQRNIKAKAGWRAVWLIINALTYFAQHPNVLLLSSISTNILQMLVNIPNKVPPLPLKTL